MAEERGPLLQAPTTPSKALNKTIQTNDESENSNSEWNTYHTSFSITIRIVCDLLTKSVYVYYRDYQHALGLTSMQFSYVVIATQIGSLIAVIILPFVNQILPSLQHKVSTFAFTSGLFGMLLFVPAQYNNFDNDTTMTLTWCVTTRLLYGASFFIFITSLLDLAAYVNNDVNHGRLIAVLNLSWTFATLLYLSVGLFIQFINWWFSFVLFGCILCVLAVCSHFVFQFDVQPISTTSSTPMVPSSPISYRRNVARQDSEANSEGNSWQTIKTVLVSGDNPLFFAVSLVMGCFNGSFTVIVSGIWTMDLFGLSSSEVGAVALAIFCGEFTAVMLLSKMIDSFGAFKCAFLPFGSVLCISFASLILCFTIGPTVGGLAVAIFIIFVLYFGWESFFILHQYLCIQNAPPNMVSMMLLINFVFLGIGNVFGTYISPSLWQNGQGLFVINLVWIFCVFCSSAIYMILYFRQSKTDELTPSDLIWESI